MRRATRVTVLLAVVATAAWMMWPAALGGRTTYVVTHGTSMQPLLHSGDLGVVRPASHYRVGDVVAYRSTLLHTVVMHRVVAINHGHYTFQGDNNTWLDPETPHRSELIGTLDLRIPQGGTWLHDIVTAPILAGAAFLLAATGGAVTQSRRTRRRHHMSRHTALGSGGAVLPWLSPTVRTAAAATTVAGLLGLVLGFGAWTGPVDTTAVTSQPANRWVTFDYSASVPRSPAYDATRVASPAPIFRTLTNTVDVNYTYHGPPGRISVVATLSAPSGWEATLPLAAADSFTADRYHGTVRLHLNRLQARADAAARATGIPNSGLAVLITTTVTTPTATPSVAPFKATMPLTLTPLQLTTAADHHHLTLTDTATASRVVRRTRDLEAAGYTMPITTARLTSSVLLILTLIAGCLLTWLTRRSTPLSEGARIRRRYAPLLVAIAPLQTPADHRVVDVADFDALARVAAQLGLFVLHWTRADIDTFVVRDQATTYCYRSGPPRSPDVAGPRAGM